jgi:hypothetical protein
MTQEQKDLLLKDLCARLPYGVKILIQDIFEYSIVSPERHVLDVSNFSDIFCFNYEKLDKRMKKAMRERPDDIVIKPYLFPLSSMTEKQKKEYNRWKHEVPVCHYEYGDVVEEVELFDSPESFEYLIENHFDYHGLIPMGLAIDATGLDIY